MSDYLSFDQVMAEIRATGAVHMEIRVELGDKEGGGGKSKSAKWIGNPQDYSTGEVAQKLLGRVQTAAESFDKR